MNGQIFICYRREDSAYAAGRLFDRLSKHFDTDRIFMDISTIKLGMDFQEKIEDAVNACDILLAVIGRNWQDVTDGDDVKRLENPNDFVRLEIYSALVGDTHVIPVLIDGATMPLEKDLPAALKPLARRNGMEIRHSSFDADVGQLIVGIDEIISQKSTLDEFKPQGFSATDQQHTSELIQEFLSIDSGMFLNIRKIIDTPNKFLFFWVIATVIGGFIGWRINSWLNGIVPLYNNVADAFVFALVLSSSQWLVLRSIYQNSWRWIIASVIFLFGSYLATLDIDGDGYILLSIWLLICLVVGYFASKNITSEKI